MSVPIRFIQLRERVKNLLGEQTLDETGLTFQVESEYWPDAEIDRYVNDAYIEAAKDTKALEMIAGIATTADEGTYTLVREVGQVMRVEYDSRKVYPTTKWELDRTEPDWENLSGYVSNYILTQMNNRRLRLFKAPSEGGGFSVGDSDEFGAVTDIGDGVNTFTFSSEYGVIADTSGGDWDVTFAGEYGEVILLSGTSNNLFVWATRVPPLLVEATDAPELPNWCHLGIAYRAAAKALGKHGEQGDMEKAEVYDALANEYGKLLKGFVANRSGERIVTMSRGGNRQRRPRPWDQEIVD